MIPKHRPITIIRKHPKLTLLPRPASPVKLSQSAMSALDNCRTLPTATRQLQALVGIANRINDAELIASVTMLIEDGESEHHWRNRE